MRFNWNAIVAAVGFLADEPAAGDSLSGNGFSVTRTGSHSFEIQIEELDDEVKSAVTDPPSPENPSGSVTVDSPVPVEASETETPENPTPDASPVPDNPGNVSAEATSTGSSAPITGAVSTGQ